MSWFKKIAQGVAALEKSIDSAREAQAMRDAETQEVKDARAWIKMKDEERFSQMRDRLNEGARSYGFRK